MGCLAGSSIFSGLKHRQSESCSIKSEFNLNTHTLFLQYVRVKMLKLIERLEVKLNEEEKG